MAQPLSMPPAAAQASLRADAKYLDLLGAQSAWPAQYAMSRPNAVQARSQPRLGLVAGAVGPQSVDTYNTLLPQAYRVAKRASQNRLQTELVNTAPYVAVGRGVANHVDSSSALLLGRGSARGDASRATLAEGTWDRRDFVALPSELRRLPVEMRFGEMTRVGPSYAQPHDE